MQIRTTPAEIRDYFEVDFLPKKPVATLVESYVAFPSGNIAVHNGKYNFDVTDPSTGATSVAKARFTYVWERNPSGSWKITTHHSSKLPEPTQ